MGVQMPRRHDRVEFGECPAAPRLVGTMLREMAVGFAFTGIKEVRFMVI